MSAEHIARRTIAFFLLTSLANVATLIVFAAGFTLGSLGTVAIYHVSLAAATVAVLAYRALALWIPALLGTVAFVQLRNTLRGQAQPALICEPLAGPIERTKP